MIVPLARLSIGIVDALLVGATGLWDGAGRIFIDGMHMGGPLMWPIVLSVVLVLAFLVRDAWVLRRLHTRLAVRRRLMELLEADRPDLALRLCMLEPHGGIQRVVTTAIRHAAQPRHLIARAVQEEVLDIQRRLAPVGRPLPMIAKTVVLTGLLGTIQGLIMSFEAVARASAETKSTMLMGGGALGTLGSRRAPWMALPPDGAPVAADVHVHPGLARMVSTREARVSTFALDVDTASYTLVRKRLEDGWLPVPEAVRVEEFVNALPYSYAPAAGEAPFTVYLEAAPDPLAPERHLLAVGLKGKVFEGPRPGLNLVFLVDTSGSMDRRDRLPLARSTLHELLDNLEDHDTVALATFSGGASMVLGPTSVRERAEIHRAIDRLRPSGSTAMAEGLALAYRLAAEGWRPGCENRVVLVSDGGANVGPSDHESILAELGELRAHTTLTAVGFGTGGYRDHLMEQLADRGDGNAFYVDSKAEARRIFGRELTSTLVTIARDVKVQVAFDPELVRSWRLLGYENRLITAREFRDDEVDAGELGSGHEVTALYQLELQPEPSGGSIALVHLRARPPSGDGPAEEWITSLSAKAIEPSFEAASSDLHAAWVAATFAERLRESPFTEGLDYIDLWRGARAVQRPFPEDQELLDLIATAARIDGGGGPLAWRCMALTDGWEGCL
jgi:Ca-activated chloride channel family protein